MCELYKAEYRYYSYQSNLYAKINKEMTKHIWTTIAFITFLFGHFALFQSFAVAAIVLALAFAISNAPQTVRLSY